MSFLLIVLGSLVLALLFGVKWEKAIPVWTMTLLLGTYFMGVLHKLRYLKYIKEFLIVALIVSVIYGLISKKLIYNLKKGLSQGSIIFWIVCIIMGIAVSTHKIIEWDDLNHWATVTKQIFMQNNIPTGANSVSSYSDYHPLGALAFYFFLSDFKNFHEELLFPIQYFLISMCFIPFWGNIRFKKGTIVKNILALFICIVFPLQISFHTLLHIKADSLLSALFAFSVIELWILGSRFVDKKTDINMLAEIMNLSLAVVCMAITKSAGILLCIFVLLAFAVVIICNKKYDWFVYMVATGGLTYVFYWAWEKYCDYYGNVSYISQGFSGIEVNDYLNTLIDIFRYTPGFLYCIFVFMLVVFAFCVAKKRYFESKYNIVLIGVFIISAVISYFCRNGYLDKWFSQFVDDGSNGYVVCHYLYAFCTWPVTYVYEIQPWGMSTLECCMAVMFITVFLKYFLNVSGYRKAYLPIFCVIVVGWFVYILGHMTMYMTMFGGTETSGLSAFSRYLMIYAAGLFSLSTYVIYEYLMADKSCICDKGIVLLAVCVAVVGNLSSTYKQIFEYDEMPYVQLHMSYRDNAEKNVEYFADYQGGDFKYIRLAESSASQIEQFYKFLLSPYQDVGKFSFDNFDTEQFAQCIENNDVKYLIVDGGSIQNGENADLLNALISEYHLEKLSDTVYLCNNS